MQLKLTNPIIFFDLETTGVDVVKDRIVEISLVKVSPDGTEEIKTRRINPGMHIPEGATAIHGISDEDVKDSPSFKSVAKSLANYIEGSDLAGYNSNKFDIPMLMEEFLRAGVDIDLKKRKCVDVQNIFHKMEQRTLSAAYKFYCDEDLSNAHSAEADTLATYEILKRQLERYPDMENSVDYLSKFSERIPTADYAGRIAYDEAGVEIINFGKHKGKRVTDVLRKEPSYYDWMMKGDFPEYTKKVLTKIKLSMK